MQFVPQCAASSRYRNRSLRIQFWNIDRIGNDRYLRKLDGLQLLPDIAKGLQRAGVKRVGTWISPSHHELTFLKNFKSHQERLGKIAKIYHDCGIQMGLEYVGPKTSWTSKKFPFIHTMEEAKELILAIDCPNVGLVLDSWHWYCASETVEDILTLSVDQVAAERLGAGTRFTDHFQAVKLVDELHRIVNKFHDGMSCFKAIDTKRLENAEAQRTLRINVRTDLLFATNEENSRFH